MAMPCAVEMEGCGNPLAVNSGASASAEDWWLTADADRLSGGLLVAAPDPRDTDLRRPSADVRLTSRRGRTNVKAGRRS